MTISFDAALLARIQFAFTISFHIIFPAFTIGLASWLAVVEGLWLYTKKELYRDIYKFWVKIFAVTFGMGVVSGVVMSYQIGTNWAGFAFKIGNVLGPLLGFEVLTAFFLEASFLGIMLFGWDKVSPRMHFFSTLIVAIGTLVSAFWILSANSWMQTPTGFEQRADGMLYPLNWLEIIFNPSFPYRFMHMITGAYLTTAFVVSGVGAWYLLKKRYQEHARIMVGMGMLMAALVAPLQLVLGDLHGLNTLKHQPIKVAAMEGIWETEKGAALLLWGMPDQKKEETLYKVAIPKLASIILTHDANGVIKGLKEWKASERPPVIWVFWSFRIMVGIGLLMIATGIVASWLWWRKKLFNSKKFLSWCLLMGPSGFIAILAGWFVTEIGRQPYIAYGVMRTSEALSPVLGEHIALSLTAFIIVYTIIFGAGLYYIGQLISKGVLPALKVETFGTHGMKEPVTLATLISNGDKHV